MTGLVTGGAVLRVTAALALLLVGAVTGLAGVLLHGRWWGLALVAVVTLAAAWLLPGRWWARVPFVLGWVLLVMVALRGRPEGDFLVASTLQGYLFLGTGAVLALLAALGLRHARPARGDESGGLDSPS